MFSRGEGKTCQRGHFAGLSPVFGLLDPKTRGFRAPGPQNSSLGLSLAPPEG